MSREKIQQITEAEEKAKAIIADSKREAKELVKRAAIDIVAKEQDQRKDLHSLEIEKLRQARKDVQPEIDTMKTQREEELRRLAQLGESRRDKAVGFIVGNLFQ